MIQADEQQTKKLTILIYNFKNRKTYRIILIRNFTRNKLMATAICMIKFSH